MSDNTPPRPRIAPGASPQRHHAARDDSRAFTLIELLVVIAVIAILASLTMPSILNAMRMAQRVQCGSNLSQLGKASALYADQWDQYYPRGGNPGANTGEQMRDVLAPPELIRPYADDPKVFLCPTDISPSDYWWWVLKHPTLTSASYMWNEYLLNVNYRYSSNRRSFNHPATLGLIADGRSCPSNWTWQTCLLPQQWECSRCDWHHDGGVNMLFGDLHVDKVLHHELVNVRILPHRP